MSRNSAHRTLLTFCTMKGIFLPSFDASNGFFSGQTTHLRGVAAGIIEVIGPGYLINVY